MTRRAVVTGGGTGIGRAVARRLAAGGDEVTIVGRRSEVLKATAAELNTEFDSDRVGFATGDLADPDQVTELAAQLVAGGPIDVLVNNAGGNPNQPSTDLTGLADAYTDAFRINVITAVLLTEALLPDLSRPGASIVSVSSIAALRGAGPYGAAKAALHGWALGLASQLAPQGITVNVVAPGFVAGDRILGYPPHPGARGRPRRADPAGSGGDSRSDRRGHRSSRLAGRRLDHRADPAGERWHPARTWLRRNPNAPGSPRIDRRCGGFVSSTTTDRGRVIPSRVQESPMVTSSAA